MTVEAANADINLGYHDLCKGGSHQASSVARGGAAAATAAVGTGDRPGYVVHPLLREPVDVAVMVKTLTPSPRSAPARPGGGAAADCGGGGGGGQKREGTSSSSTTSTTTSSDARRRSSRHNVPGSSSGSGATAVNLAAEEAPVWRSAGAGGDQGDESPPSAGGARCGAGEGAAAATGVGEEEGQERTMQVRVELPRLLQLSLTPDARVALTGCIGGNVLAAGFHGKFSENFPLLASSPASPFSSLGGGGGADDVMKRSGRNEGDVEGEGKAEAECIEYEKERRGRMQPGRAEGSPPKQKNREGMLRGGRGEADPSFPSAGAVQQQQQQQPFPPPPSSSGTAIGSGWEGEGAPLPLACPVCADSFDELLARHQCSWCEGMVCRKCMHTQVGRWMGG